MLELLELLNKHFKYQKISTTKENILAVWHEVVTHDNTVTRVASRIQSQSVAF